MFYILHGENDLEQEEALTGLIRETGLEDELRDLNLTTVTPPLSAGELRRVCQAIPFLGSVRVVVVRDALSDLNGKGWEAVREVLETLPPTTHLIFTESRQLPAAHPALRYAKEVHAPVKAFPLPTSKALPAWIEKRVRHHGGQIQQAAAALLARNIGNHLRLLDQEIQKLLLYVEGEHPITVEDVRVMVPYVQSAEVIFDLVDALGQRHPREALRHLHRLLDVGEDPLRLFGMIVRQFRLLVQVRWLLDHGSNRQEIASHLHLHPFVARKLSDQVTYFTPEQLHRAYERLLACDLAAKTGQMPWVSALDLLVVELASV